MDTDEPSSESVAPRLPVDVVRHIHRLVGGDSRTETMVERFIADQYGAKNLLYLPPKAATQIIRRPADFLNAVKNHCEPELFAEGQSFRTGTSQKLG